MTSKEKTKTLVNKATTDDRTPPSGYLLKELSSRTMSISECQTIEDLVMKKLAKNKPNIKFKALRIVKFLCENGSPNWRRAWQRNTDKLRDAQQFRGTPDPIYGDAPYESVRTAAKEAMQAVFQTSTVDSSHLAGRIKGWDGSGSNSSNNSSSYGAPSNNSSSSTFASGKIGVFGGPSSYKNNKAPSAPANSWNGGKQYTGRGNTSYQPQARTVSFTPLKGSQQYTNPAVLSGKNVHSTRKLDTRGSGKRKKHNPGGIWASNDDNNANDSDESDNNESEPEEEDYNYDDDEDYTRNSNSYGAPKKKQTFGGHTRKAKASSGQYEKRWVDDIVKSGGVGCKIRDVSKYVQQFENLSKSHVLEYLDEKLLDAAWQKQGKAVSLIEALLDGRSSDDVVEYFSQSPENLRSLASSKKSIIKRKVNNILNSLEVSDNEEEEEEEEEVSKEEEEVQEMQNMDILNMGQEEEEEEEDDMFANMDTSEQVAPPTVTDLMGTANMLPDLMGSDPVPPANDNANDIMNIIGDSVDVNMNANNNNNNNNNNAPAQQNKRPKSNYAFLDSLATEENVVQTNTSASSNLLTMAGNNSTPATTNNNNNGNAGNAFGLDLNGTSANTSASANNTMNNGNASSGSGAFGLDLGGSNSNPSATTQPSMAMGMNNMGMNPMMTPQMLQNNAQNRQFNMAQMNNMQSMMQQMQAMQMNMNGMNMMNPNMANMMQQMQQMQANMSAPTQPQAANNLFNDAMASVSGMQTQARASPAYAHNDPFGPMIMSGNAQQNTATTVKKSGPDPFAEFGLKSIK